MMTNAVFLDRNGVIIENKPPHLHKIEDIKFIQGLISGLKLLKNDFKFFIVTNQSGISRGYYGIQDAISINNYIVDYLMKYDIRIEDIAMCPHSPLDFCDCRKPKPKMIDDLVQKYNINKKNSYFIGDSEIDILTARNANIYSVLLTKSYNKISRFNNKPNYVAFSFYEACFWIKHHDAQK